MYFRYRVSLVALLALGLPALAWAQSFQGVGDLAGGTYCSEAHGVSADGQVVVGRSKSATCGSYWEAFRWTAAGGIVGLGYLPGGISYSEAEAASADGAVVAGRSHSAPGFQACRWVGTAAPEGLGDLPGGDFRSETYACSGDGNVIVGASKSGNCTQAWAYEAFRWTPSGGMVGLGDLAGGYFDSNAMGVSADGTIIAGTSDRRYTSYEAYYGAFRWTAAGGMVGIGELGGGDYYSWAWGMSADGTTIVGCSDGSENSDEAFRWTSSTGMVSLGNTPDVSFSLRKALAASGDGSVIVGNGTTSSGTRAFIWDATHGMRRLDDVLVNEYQLNLSGWTLSEARGISADGQTIVGIGLNPDGNYEGWVARLSGPSGCPGDADCDGHVGFSDIDFFVAAIPDNEAAWAALYAARHEGNPPPCAFLNNDCTGDGHANFADIDPFVALIPSVCP